MLKSYASKQRLDLVGHRPVNHVGGKHLVLRLLEATLVLLTVDERGEALPLFLQEGRRNPRAPRRRNLEPFPPASADPLLVENAAPSVRRGEHYQRAAADGEHGPNGVVEAVVYPAGLVHEQKRGTGEAPDGLLRSRQRDDPGSVL